MLWRPFSGTLASHKYNAYWLRIRRETPRTNIPVARCKPWASFGALATHGVRSICTRCHAVPASNCYASLVRVRQFLHLPPDCLSANGPHLVALQVPASPALIKASFPIDTRQHFPIVQLQCKTILIVSSCKSFAIFSSVTGLIRVIQSGASFRGRSGQANRFLPLLFASTTERAGSHAAEFQLLLSALKTGSVQRSPSTPTYSNS